MTPNTTIRIAPEVRQKLEEIAKKEDRSLAYIIRTALDYYIKHQEQKREKK